VSFVIKMKEEEAPMLKTATALQCETTSDEDEDDDDDDDDGKTAVKFVSMFRLLMFICCCMCDGD